MASPLGLSLIMVFLPLLLTLTPKFSQLAQASSIGVCYGTLGNDLPTAEDVVQIFMSNSVHRMRIYDPNDWTLQALRNSSILLTVGVRNMDLPVLAGSPNLTRTWIDNNIMRNWPEVSFRYIVAGNEVIPGDLAKFVLPAMTNIYKALKSMGLHNRIKVSTSVAMSVIGQSYPPSTGQFSNDSSPYMVPVAKFLSKVGAPLLINLYPYFSYVSNPRLITLSYALFMDEVGSRKTVWDGPYPYWNLFDAMLDSVHAALENAGAPKVRVVVSESGWPSAGGFAANVPNARTYNTNLVRHVAQGTPRRPTRPIETYLFALFNENQKPVGVEQNWGLFYPDKRPLYPFSFP